MMNKILYFFVEGNDDELFFEQVIKPKLSTSYLEVKTWKYSQQTKKDIRRFLASVRAMHAKGVAESVFVADLDESKCVEKKKEILLRTYELLSQNDQERDWSRSWIRIVIVCKEIESWYLAGLSGSDCLKLGIRKALPPTDIISKEDFDGIIPDKFESRIDFMLEILKLFRSEIACTRNTSFNYLIRNCVNELQ